MKHIVCLTKTHNENDFRVWYRYHHAFGYKIHIIDNESPAAIQGFIQEGDTYEKLEGWPNQWQLCSDILNENRYDFKKGDLVAFIDDDEFLWYYLDYWKLVEQHDPKFKGKEYESFETYVTKQMGRQTLMGLGGCVLVPQTLMSTHELKEDRPNGLSYVDMSIYRRDDRTSQGKAIVMYDPRFKYDFTVRTGKEYGHVPVISKNDPSKETRFSVVNGVGLSQSTYGDTDYTACLRLYHYHIKTEWDWNVKYQRGSAAVDHQWYAQDICANKNFGGYDIVDFTMQETKKLLGI